MQENKLPHNSIDELVEFFDSNDMGDYLDEMPEAAFEVELKTKRHLVEIDEEVAEKLSELAKEKQMTTEALINSLLREQITNSNENAIR